MSGTTNRRSAAKYATLLAITLAALGIAAAVAVLSGSGPGAGGPSRFWADVYGIEASGPAYASLAEVGARSQAIIRGRLVDVAPGREVRDLEAEANGSDRASTSVFHANITVAIDEIIGGTLPAADRDSILVEVMIGSPDQVASLKRGLPRHEFVLFVGSSYFRDRGVSDDLYYVVGLGEGVFENADGVVAPAALRDDPALGRLGGLRFTKFVDMVRAVPVLDRPLEG